MSTIFLVPTTPKPQTFFISLNAVSYQFTIKWNTSADCWVLDIADNNGVPMAQGLPLITGADLLGQLAELGITGQLIVQSDNDPNEVPNFTTLGVSGNLYYNSPVP